MSLSVVAERLNDIIKDRRDRSRIEAKPVSPGPGKGPRLARREVKVKDCEIKPAKECATDGSGKAIQSSEESAESIWDSLRNQQQQEGGRGERVKRESMV
ncbi:hypothetical protein MPTK1_4g09600 [Marchantia polymorpha subsp. ruderalis]|uniref:Uncharacterized protein n=2 Tax=Marchantia polymorpha TaxID=3197 RepID=A0AAF6B859_MARPO|nr:hypothetical protein MARPO_0132s0003 [Marchantia polymorpha]BBN08193.1 hypothetical protein Mp_4g09600 [Marchantia polymorpha subsp. ruderalis]|eukprot:PTQ29923.1 hypothetical protein MARPO_0132s0003 [Marchantia polymorpha]